LERGAGFIRLKFSIIAQSLIRLKPSLIGGMKASSRYLKENYRRIYVRRELYEGLRKLAEAEGLTVPDLVARLYNHYAGAGAQLLQRLERLEAEVAELRRIQEDVRRLLEG
jgi:predicted DNA-binding ribbon-helix-helix protein